MSRVKKRTVSIRHPSPSLHFTLKMMPTPEVIYFLLKLIVTNIVIFMGTPTSEPCEVRMWCGKEAAFRDGRKVWSSRAVE